VLLRRRQRCPFCQCPGTDAEPLEPWGQWAPSHRRCWDKHVASTSPNAEHATRNGTLENVHPVVGHAYMSCRTRTIVRKGDFCPDCDERQLIPEAK
jgi:hypothetical protein